MKIRLLHDLPIDEKHKAVKGAVFDAHAKLTNGERGGRDMYFCTDANGEEFGVRLHECEEVENG